MGLLRLVERRGKAYLTSVINQGGSTEFQALCCAAHFAVHSHHALCIGTCHKNIVLLRSLDKATLHSQARGSLAEVPLLASPMQCQLRGKGCKSNAQQLQAGRCVHRPSRSLVGQAQPLQCKPLGISGPAQTIALKSSIHQNASVIGILSL